MVTAGDVFAVTGFLIGLGLTSWAIIVSFGLLFPMKSERAQSAIIGAPWKTLSLGAVLALVPGFFSVVLLAQPLPGVKLLGWIILLALLSLAAIGGAGLSMLASERLRALAPGMQPYAGFVRGAGYLVCGSMLPLLGWFAFGPVALLFSIGAGFRALLSRAEEPVLHGTAA